MVMQIGFQVIAGAAAQNAAAHFRNLSPSSFIEDGVVDRILEPLAPFLDNQPKHRRSIFGAAEDFKDSLSKLVTEADLKGPNDEEFKNILLGALVGYLEDKSLKLPGLGMISYDELNSRIARFERVINGGVVFRENLLSERTGERIRVFTSFGDLGLMIGVASTLNWVEASFVMVENPAVGGLEIRIGKKVKQANYENRVLPDEILVGGGYLTYVLGEGRRFIVEPLPEYGRNPDAVKKGFETVVDTFNYAKVVIDDKYLAAPPGMAPI